MTNTLEDSLLRLIDELGPTEARKHFMDLVKERQRGRCSERAMAVSKYAEMFDRVLKQWEDEDAPAI